jgi:hypothetical protein
MRRRRTTRATIPDFVSNLNARYCAPIDAMWEETKKFSQQALFRPLPVSSTLQIQIQLDLQQSTHHIIFTQGPFRDPSGVPPSP